MPAIAEPVVDPDVLSVDVAGLAEALDEDARRHCGTERQVADPQGLSGLLRPGGKWRGERADGESGDESSACDYQAATVMCRLSTRTPAPRPWGKLGCEVSAVLSDTVRLIRISVPGTVPAAVALTLALTLAVLADVTPPIAGPPEPRALTMIRAERVDKRHDKIGCEDQGGAVTRWDCSLTSFSSS